MILWKPIAFTKNSEKDGSTENDIDSKTDECESFNKI